MGINNFDEAAAARLSRVPIPWVKHEAKSAGDPCKAQLIALAGLEVLASGENSHLKSN